jgi:hypothetical protein
MPEEAGIQGREGMDTGFRRYDETFVPNHRLDPTCRCIFEGGHEAHEVRRLFHPNPFRVLRDLRGEKDQVA